MKQRQLNNADTLHQCLNISNPCNFSVTISTESLAHYLNSIAIIITTMAIIIVIITIIVTIITLISVIVIALTFLTAIIITNHIYNDCTFFVVFILNAIDLSLCLSPFYARSEIFKSQPLVLC